MDLERLKAETREDHQATESVMPLMGPGVTRTLYASVLCRLYPLVEGWEKWALFHSPPDLIPVLSKRRRSELLACDLRSLGAAVVDSRADFPAHLIPGLQVAAPGFRSSFLGAMYVMEGSTLGGRYIARNLHAVLGLVPGQSDAYFLGYGERTGEMWLNFQAVLADIPDRESGLVISAAQAMFGIFRAGMLISAAETCSSSR